MNPLAKLEQLSLDDATKTELAAMLQALIDQVSQDAKTIQTKDATIHAKDIKIGALSYELAH